MSSVLAERPQIVVFCGMTASGKSYLARNWAERRGYPYFNTDVVRKELAGRAAQTAGEAGLDEGIYTPEFSRRTYDRLLQYAETAADNTSTIRIVLDGSYHRQEERRRVLARFSGKYKVYFVLCYCAEAVTRKRLEKRLRDPDAVSDGRLEVYRMQKRIFEKPSELPPDQLLELDTDATLEYLIGRLERFLGSSAFY